MIDIYNKLINDVKGKKCAVLGLGISNLPLVKLLLFLKVEADITVYDKKPPEALGEEALKLQKKGIRFVSGENCFDEIDADIIFRSPGIRPDKAGIPAAVERGAEITSEMEVFLGLTPARTFAITGSDGKTTTTTICGKFLSESGRAFVGGNIGRPLIDICGNMTERDSVVLELSSFQLINMTNQPECVAITNITPNHLDWHTDEDEYAQAKYNIVGERTRRVVVNADNQKTRRFGKRLVAEGEREVVFFSSTARSYFDVMKTVEDNASVIFCKGGDIYISDGRSSELLLDTSLIRLPGIHNVENYMTAIGLTYGYVDKSAYVKVASTFGGVEHRLELVRRLHNVDYYNSSIDSSPTRTAAALSALSGRDIVVICGGYDKNLDYAPLAESLYNRVRAVVLTGATAPKIKAALAAYNGAGKGGLTIVEAKTFEKAVTTASSLAQSGGCVLLSPASASFDRFKNFAERGKYFKELVKGLK